MNNINSLIIEGKIEEIQKGETKTVCKISTERFFKNSSGYTVKETSIFECLFYGNLAELVNKKCDVGRCVRIVGRLRQDIFINEMGKKESQTVIISEHLEIKPKIQ